MLDIVLLSREGLIALYKSFKSCSGSLWLPLKLILASTKISGFESLTELMSVVLQRVGDDIDPTHLPRLMVYHYLTLILMSLLILILTHI